MVHALHCCSGTASVPGLLDGGACFFGMLHVTPCDSKLRAVLLPMSLLPTLVQGTNSDLGGFDPPLVSRCRSLSVAISQEVLMFVMAYCWLAYFAMS